jgi:DNA polymerase I-like protein with 3'-5' exonuclease and polymerase domains
VDHNFGAPTITTLSRNIILDETHLNAVVDYFMTQPAFAFDVETMGDERGVPTRNNITWLSMATEGMTVVIPMGHPNGDVLISRATKKKNRVTNGFDQIPAVYDAAPKQMRPSRVWQILRRLFFSDKIKIAQNATFDLLSVTKYFGETPPGPYADTIVMQWLLDENLLRMGLKDMVKSYYKVDYDKEGVGKCVEAWPFSKVAHYAFMDAKYTWFLYKRFLKRIEDEGLTKIYALEMAVLGVLLDMHIEGAPVDVERLHTLEGELSELLVIAEADAYKAAGKAFNLNAPMQKAHLLYDKKADGGQGIKPFKLTKGGKAKKKAGEPILVTDYSTDKDALDNYSNPLAQAILNYQEINKLLGTYVQGYLGVEGDKDRPCRIFDGRIRADLVQYGTVTGRFSCREPNLQNIPRPDTDLGNRIRGLFVAPEGYRMIVADYGQIEMVILAHFIGRGALYDGLHAGLDPHTATAAAVFSVPPSEVTKDQRQAAKGINFAVVYGAGPEKVAAMSNSTVEEAKKFLSMHQSAFPEIYRFKEWVLETVRGRKPHYLTTILGRKRRLPKINSGEKGIRGYTERQAVNSLIQGSAADLIKYAMVRLGDSLPDDMRLILSVHDELVVLCPEDRVEVGREVMREAMLGAGIQSLISVPLKSDILDVHRWSEAKA